MSIKQSLFSTFCILIALTFASAVTLVGRVAAATLTLQNIGASSVGGQHISSWTYTGSANPVFSGTADPDAAVTIAIDDASGSATADSTGNWSYTPTTLTTEGTHQVTITSGDQTLAFTLALSPSMAATGGSAADDATISGTTKGGVDELPVSGGLEDTLKLVGVGLYLIVMGGVSWWISRELRSA